MKCQESFPRSDFLSWGQRMSRSLGNESLKGRGRNCQSKSMSSELQRVAGGIWKVILGVGHASI